MREREDGPEGLKTPVSSPEPGGICSMDSNPKGQGFLLDFRLRVFKFEKRETNGELDETHLLRGALLLKRFGRGLSINQRII